LKSRKKTETSIRSSAAEYLTFVAATGSPGQSVEMRYGDENIWLAQKMMATLYDEDTRTINDHIQKVFSDNELQEDSTIRNFRIVQTEGLRQVEHNIKHYNLQMIISVGFKVNNERAVRFRKWANQGLRSWKTAPHGKISHEQAKLRTETEFEKYRIVQDRLFESDFDRFFKLEIETKKPSGETNGGHKA